MKNLSIKVKIIGASILLPTLLLCGLFAAYVVQAKKDTIDNYVAKARAVTLTVESTRQGMEELYQKNVFNAEMLRAFADAGMHDKLLAAVPVVSSWRAAMRKAKEGGYTFKVPKFQPRNPENKPDALEARALTTIKEQGLTEYYEIDEQLNAVRYFRPVVLSQVCLLCHGAPSTSMAAWGNDRGVDPTGVRMENWQAGEIHGAFEIIQSLDAADASLASSLWTGGGFVVGGLLLYSILLVVFVVRQLVKPLDQSVNMIESMGNGDLTKRLADLNNDEMGRLGKAMNAFADSLQFEILTAFDKLAHGDFTFEAKGLIREPLAQCNAALNDTMGQVQVAGFQISSGADQISDTSQQLSQAATEQASSLEEINSSMTEMASRTQQNADNAIQANKLASEACTSAAKGNTQMQDMVGAMAEINESAQNISRIIKVIDEIAFQTNLLALNAAVEAARAGQHGKGFAVVAEEVRNLAARSAKAASETASLIEGAVQKASNGTTIAEGTAEALDSIVTSITKVSDLVGEIASASDEQTQGIDQISIGLTQIDDVTQQNTGNAVQCAATSEELAAQAGQLREMLDRFTLYQGVGQGNLSMAPNMSAPHNKPPSKKQSALPASTEWGGGKTSSAEFIALDDDEFGKF
ncbi:MAG: methyl-accepting chemotaxis protein [Desulfuromonas sp.]|nr:methyl-accepting chemotaxis protein [Desulfuromonas sp.]